MPRAGSERFPVAPVLETLRLWNAKTGALIKTFGDQVSQITRGDVNRIPNFDVGRIESIMYSPSGGQIAFGSDDRCVYIWDMTTGTLVHRLIGHDDCITSVTYSPDGKMIASGSDDWTVFLWDAEFGTPLRRLAEHSKGVADVAFSPCGNHIASGSFDKTLIIWHADGDKHIKKLAGHTDVITSVVYSPDGERIASGSNDRMVRVWDVDNGVSTELRGHTDRVRSVVFSPCGQEIASGSLDNTVKLWVVGSVHKPTEIKVFQSPIRSIAWVENNPDKDGHDEDCHDKDCHDKNDPDKKDIVSFIAVGSDDKSVRVWSVRRIEGALQVRLQWSSTHDRLVVSGAEFGETLGLSELNRKLLEQCRAKGLVNVEQQRITQAMKVSMADENIVSKSTAASQTSQESRREWDVSSDGNNPPQTSPQGPDVHSSVADPPSSPLQEPLELS
ncbi:unnamed protein product [Mortierella alpina]